MNKPSSTMNESANMQLQYQRVVCVPFPDLVDAPYNDKHSTFSNKDKHDAQSTKSKTTQDDKKEKETYNYNTSDCFQWEDDGDPLSLPRRHSFFDFETGRSNSKQNVIQNSPSSPSFCSSGRRSSLQILGTTNESEQECNDMDDFLYVMLLRR